MTPNRMNLAHIFVDHSNVWGGVRLASRVKRPGMPEDRARLSVRKFDAVLRGRRQGVSTKIVCGGIPPGMDVLWGEYEQCGYNTQRLYKGADWKERGVDHAIVGHMWRLLALYKDAPTTLVLASGDGKQNEFGTSFYEVLCEILRSGRYPDWRVELASFDWDYPGTASIRSPTATKVKRLIDGSANATFINLFHHFDTLVYYQKAL